MRARLGTTFQSLTVRNYRLFASGQIIKLVGVWMHFIAQDWLVLELTDNSAYALGLVTALQFTPILLLTLYGGKLADRHDKRRLLIVGQRRASVVLALGLGVLVATGAVTLTWVFIFAAAMGATTAIETPVRQAFVSELVPRELLPNALSLSAAIFNTRPHHRAGPGRGGHRAGRHGARSSCSAPSPTSRRRSCSPGCGSTSCTARYARSPTPASATACATSGSATT